MWYMEFTKQEAQLLINVLLNAPVNANVETALKGLDLTLVQQTLNKLQAILQLPETDLTPEPEQAEVTEK